jgi:hypothetical protein
MNKQDSETFLQILGCAFLPVVVFLVLIYSYAAGGFVFSKLWLWFAVPVFGVEELTVAQSVGLCMLISFVTKNNNYSSDKKSEEGFEKYGQYIFAIAQPWVALLVGWIIYSVWIVN